MSLITLEPETLPVMTELADEEISELVGGLKDKSAYVGDIIVNVPVNIAIVTLSDNTVIGQVNASFQSKAQLKIAAKQAKLAGKG